MRIIVNHVTRMRTNERICVAGIAPQAREHLRPVTPRTDLITRALLRETGGPFGPGAIAELGPVTACPNRPESEDHWFSTANARHIGDLSDDEYIEILEQTADPTLHEAFGNALIEIRSRKFGVPAGEGTRSLAVVPVLGRPTLRIDDYGNLHLHLDNPDTAAKLRVTDVRFTSPTTTRSRPTSSPTSGGAWHAACPPTRWLVSRARWTTFTGCSSTGCACTTARSATLRRATLIAANPRQRQAPERDDPDARETALFLSPDTPFQSVPCTVIKRHIDRAAAQRPAETGRWAAKGVGSACGLSSASRAITLAVTDVSDANDPTTTFLNALSAAANEAVSGGLHLRLVLKGGEVVEGVPESVKSDASNRPGSGWTPPPEQRHLYVDRVETSVEIGDTEVLLQEVASFMVSLN